MTSKVWLAVALALVPLAWLKRYALDEFQYSHAAWLVSKGQVPHRDFFEFHFELPYELLSVFYVWPEAGPERIRALRLGMVAVVALSLWAMARLNREQGALAMMVAPLIAVFSPSFVLNGTEVRPDVFAFAFFLAALATKEKGALPGVLLGLAVLSSQKVLLYGAPFLLLLNRRLVAGFAAVLAGQLLLLLATGSLGAWWEQTWVFAYRHEQAYPGFPATRYLWPAVQQQVGLFGLAALGAWASRRDRVPLLVLGTTLFSFCFARAPFPYALVPFAGMAALFAARGVAALKPQWRGVALGVVAFQGAVALWGVGSNTQQHEVLAKVGRLTAATDPVFDSSGGASARPHVGFRYYTNAWIHEAEATTLGARIAREVREAQCTAALRDVRFDWLPADAKAFVTEHFQPYDGDLRLWGQRLPAGRGTFEAVRGARYFVEPAQALRIDGREVEGPEFWLERGAHEVELDREGFVLWLPANGERWRPDFDTKPVFSTLF
ncbi:MAG: hypothetical protein JNK82_41430 [Myxococcaceae bacterium]|nr:hypothetical protein [Myxococcaceae bacterium]